MKHIIQTVYDWGVDYQNIKIQALYEGKEMIMYLRMYRDGDCDEIAKLFYETVHHVNAKDYSKEQLNAGYLDHLFVHKGFQGQGIATAICDELEKYACEEKVTVITTHASLTARPFFEKRGYQVRKQQVVTRQGVELTNFIMEKVF